MRADANFTMDVKISNNYLKDLYANIAKLKWPYGS
jgi:hypothetical protein